MKKIVCSFFIFLFLFGCNKLQNDQLHHLKRGREFVENQKYEQAITEFNSAIKLNPSNPTPYFMLAEIYFHQSDMNRFRTQVLNFVTKYKRHPFLPKLKEVDFNTPDQTILIEGIQNYKIALQNYSIIPSRQIQPSYIHYQLGWAHLVQHKYKDARDEFNKSVSKDEDRWGTNVALIFLDYLEKKGLTKEDVYYQGTPLEKKIALTFDDGPDGNYTPKILEILNKYKVKATFFMIGENVEKLPLIAKAVADAGHTMANHTYRHPNLYKQTLTTDEIKHEIDNTALTIEKITGIKPRFFRSPYNYIDEKLIEMLKAKNYHIISWTYAPRDWEKIGSEKIAQRVLQNVTNGAIFLLHDGGGNREETVKALPIIIEGIKKQGFEIVDLPELLNIQ